MIDIFPEIINDFFSNSNNFDLTYHTLDYELDNLDRFVHYRVKSVFVQQHETVTHNPPIFDKETTIVVDHYYQLEIIKVDSSPYAVNQPEDLKKAYLQQLQKVDGLRRRLR
jgi:hypothetical protein